MCSEFNTLNYRKHNDLVSKAHHAYFEVELLGDKAKTLTPYVACKISQWDSSRLGVLIRHLSEPFRWFGTSQKFTSSTVTFLVSWHFWPQQEGTKVCEISFSQFSYQNCTTRRLNPDSCQQMLYVEWHWRFGPWWSEWFRRYWWERQWEHFWEIIIQTDNFTSRRAERLNPGFIFIIILDGTFIFYTEGKKRRNKCYGNLSQ